MAKIQIGTEPFWPVPLAEELTQAVQASAIRHLEDHHDGLTTMKIEANYKNDAGAPVTDGIFQTLTIENGGQGRVPAVSAAVLAQLMNHRAQQYANKKKRRVQFIFHLFGSNADKRDWKHKYQYTLDGTPTEVVDINGDRDEEEDDAEEKLLDDDLVMAPLHVAPREAREDHEGESRGAPGAGGYIGQLMPSLAPASGGGAMAIRESREVDIAKAVQLAYAGALQEQRLFTLEIRQDQAINNRELRTTQDRVVSMMRESFNDTLVRVSESYEKQLDQKQSTLEEVKSILQETMTFMKDQVGNAVERATSAENRLRERDRQDSHQSDRLFEVASRGWDAFNEGMQMQREVLTREQQMDRDMLQEKMQSTATVGRKSAFEGAMDRVLPYAPAVLSMMIRKSGGAEESAKLVETLAMQMFSPGAGSQQAPQDPGQQAQAQDNAYAYDEEGQPLSDLCVSIRELYASLNNQQHTALRSVLPKPAWRGLEESVRTTIEASCFACIGQVEQAISGDMGIVMKVQEILQPGQTLRLMEIINFVKGTTATVTTNATAAARDAETARHHGQPGPHQGQPNGQPNGQHQGQYHGQPQGQPGAPAEPTRPTGRPFASPPSQAPTGPRRGVPPRPTPPTDEVT